MRLHPQLGAQILTPIHFLGPAAEIVRAHHERWDGLGYPRGLRQPLHPGPPVGVHELLVPP